MDLEALRAALGELLDADPADLDGEALRELRGCIDSLELVFSRWARAFQRQGGHLAAGYPGVVSWLRANCNMSGSSAADRVCVGKQVESSPAIAEAVASGGLGYQSAAALCHLLEQVGENSSQLDEASLLEWAEQMGVNDVRELCRRLRYVVDPDGAERTTTSTSSAAVSTSAAPPRACRCSTPSSTRWAGRR